MDTLSVILVVGALIFILLALILALSDCDLTLKYCEVFGKSTKSLAGKVVWVTGASSGIGQALAVELAQAGCRLVLSARRENRLKQTRQLCLDSNRSLRSEDVLVLPLDLVDFSSHSAAVETVIKYFKCIDVLVNNAGICQRGLIENTEFEVDRQLFEFDYFSHVSLTKAVLPHMISRGQGHVVVNSSLCGKLGLAGVSAYSASKHALQGYFDSLRIESYSHNIKVTLAFPGHVYSELLKTSLTETGQHLGVTMQSGWTRMAPERCARLMAVAMANSLEEVWIAIQPELMDFYFHQYFPYFAKKYGVKYGQERVNKVRQRIKNVTG